MRLPEGGTLVLTRRTVAGLMSVEACIGAVERAFLLLAEGRAPAPAVLAFPAAAGDFHIKAAALPLTRPYFAAKLNANFPANPGRGLPTIQGVVALCDADDGRLLALLDSAEITALRTGAATAVAAKRLARPRARTLAVCGCGAQARAQVLSLLAVLPLRAVRVFDLDRERARSFSRSLADEIGLPVEAADELGAATLSSDVIVTCTTSRVAFLGREHVKPGTFIAAVGADNPEKQELTPELMAAARLVVDLLDQAAVMGDLRPALAAGAVRREDVHAELADLVAGRKPGRLSEDEITVFDSTGVAVQDVAVAAAAYEAALAARRGLPVELGA